MQAFCVCPFHKLKTAGRTSVILVRTTAPLTKNIPYALASKSNKKIRPRSSKKNPPDFSTTSFPHASRAPSDCVDGTTSEGSIKKNFPPLKDSSAADVSSESENEKPSKKQRDLRKVDANGISMEHRLREEIQHPLRKPKLTLFGTLTFSATIGFFIAVARLATEKDSLAQVSTNVGVDIAAVALFGYLTWREAEFGRRAVNSIAGCPQPRDLSIMRLSSSASPFLRLPSFNRKSNSSTTERMSTVLRSSDIVIVAGRTVDLRKYLDRCMQDGMYSSKDSNVRYNTMHPTLIALATDVRDNTDSLAGATAVASREGDDMVDWIAWLGDAVPPRRNVALFRIEATDSARGAASSYVVNVDDPAIVPLPEDARKLTVVEV